MGKRVGFRIENGLIIYELDPKVLPRGLVSLIT